MDNNLILSMGNAYFDCYKNMLRLFPGWLIKDLYQGNSNYCCIDIAQPDNFDYNLKMAYSLDIRRKVLSVREKKGLTIAEVAARFDVGVASVTRWVKNIHRKPQG
ncbi:helix-turn-helix domain-containing protein, partial [Nitrosomonas communis]